MKVELIESTSIEVVMKACAVPYNSEESRDLVRKVWNSGHRSIARHSNTSFIAKEVSVSLLTQISRHPHINLTVESSRYNDMSDKDCVIPPFIMRDDEDEFKIDYSTIMNIVNVWGSRAGYNEKEQRHLSKMFLPKASTLDLVFSGNWQALYEFLQLRNCERVEWEIKELAHKVSDIMEEEVPEIFTDIGCRGDELCLCPEEESCGKYITVSQFKEVIKKEKFKELIADL